MKLLDPIKKSNLSWLWLALLVIVIDQTSKALITHYLTPYEAMHLGTFFSLNLMYNVGAAFSFLSGAGGWQTWLFGGLAIFVSLVILIWLYSLRQKQTSLAIALSLVIGGAIGNVVDRIRFGHVIDFIQFHVGHYYWPTFNIADSAICIGAIILIIDGIFFSSSEKKGEKA